MNWIGRALVSVALSSCGASSNAGAPPTPLPAPALQGSAMKPAALMPVSAPVAVATALVDVRDVATKTSRGGSVVQVGRPAMVFSDAIETVVVHADLGRIYATAGTVGKVWNGATSQLLWEKSDRAFFMTTNPDGALLINNGSHEIDVIDPTFQKKNMWLGFRSLAKWRAVTMPHCWPRPTLVKFAYSISKPASELLLPSKIRAKA